MTQVTSPLDFDQRLAHAMEAVKALRKLWYDRLMVSVEINSSGMIYILFSEPVWDKLRQQKIEQICSQFDLEYKLTPLDNKIGVTLF